MSVNVINLGVNLWNQTSNIIKYQDTGYALNERLYKFLLEFSKLQSESFQSQKKLCEKYCVDIQKCVGVENTYAKAFNEFIGIFQRLVDKESLIADSFELQAQNTLKGVLDEQKRRIKKWKADRDRFNTEMKSQTRIIEEEMKRYKDKYREMIKFRNEAERVEADKTLSRLNVEKAIVNYQVKQNEFEKARMDYSIALEQFNLYRKNHFSATLPAWGKAGESINNERCENTKNLINVLTDRFGVFVEQVARLHKDLSIIAETIDCNEDLKNLIELLENDEKPPGDIPFKDLANDGLSGGGSSISGHGSYSNTDQIYASATEPYLISVSAVDNIERTLTKMVVGENSAQINSYHMNGNKKLSADMQNVYSAISTMTNGIADKARRISLSTSGPPSMPPAPGLSNGNFIKKFFKKSKTNAGRNGETDILSINNNKSHLNISDGGGQSAFNTTNGMAESSDFSDSSEEIDLKSRTSTIDVINRNVNGNTKDTSCLPSHYAHLPLKGSQNGSQSDHNKNPISTSFYSASAELNNNNDYMDPIDLNFIGECIAIYDHHSRDLPPQYFSFAKDERFRLISSEEDEKNGWYKVQRFSDDTIGFVPVSFMNITHYSDNRNETITNANGYDHIKKHNISNYNSPGKPARKGYVAVTSPITKRPPMLRMPQLASIHVDTEL